MKAIELDAKFAVFDDVWSPKTVATFNDYHVKLAKADGEFTWHQHDETDELFLVHRGTLRIEMPTGSVDLGPGDLFVVPKGVRHRPVASEVCELVLIEPTGTMNTGDAGDAGGTLTAPTDEWL